VNGQGGLAYAAFLVEKSKDHQDFLISGFVTLRFIVKADSRQVKTRQDTSRLQYDFHENRISYFTQQLVAQSLHDAITGSYSAPKIRA
jgi:hypothetical protein